MRENSTRDEPNTLSSPHSLLASLFVFFSFIVVCVSLFVSFVAQLSVVLLLLHPSSLFFFYHLFPSAHSLPPLFCLLAAIAPSAVTFSNPLLLAHLFPLSPGCVVFGSTFAFPLTEFDLFFFVCFFSFPCWSFLSFHRSCFLSLRVGGDEGGGEGLNIRCPFSCLLSSCLLLFLLWLFRLVIFPCWRLFAALFFSFLVGPGEFGGPYK